MPPADNAKSPLISKAVYILLVLLIIVGVYMVSPFWALPVGLILVTFIATWFVPEKWRRMVRCGHLLFSLGTLLSAAFFLVLSMAIDSGVVAGSEQVKQLLENDLVLAMVSIASGFVVATIFFVCSFLLADDMSAQWILALNEVYGVTRQEARRLLGSMYLNTAHPFYLVEDGEITKTKPEGLLPKLGGPGKVVIKPNNAVVFERGGEISRIEGPGTVLTERGEKHKHIVDLRSQGASFIAEDVLTRDNVPLTFHCGVGFRIESKADTAQRAQSPGSGPEGRRLGGAIGGEYPVFRRTIYRAAYGTTEAGWKITTQGAAEGKLREVVRRYRLEDLYGSQDRETVRARPVQEDSTDAEDPSLADASTVPGTEAIAGTRPVPEENATLRNDTPGEGESTIENGATMNSDSVRSSTSQSHDASTQRSVIDEIAKTTKTMLTGISPLWGTKITSFTVKTIEVPENVGEKLTGLWAERYESERKRLETQAASDSIQLRGSAEAKAIASIEKAKLEAREALITSLTTSFLPGTGPQNEKLVERVIAALETLSAALATDTATATRYIEALESMASEAETKVVIIGEDRHLLPPLAAASRGQTANRGQGDHAADSASREGDRH